MKKIILISLLFYFTAQAQLFNLLFDDDYQADTKNWITRVTTNGGAISGSTKTAVDNFIKDITSIRSKLKRVNLFCGSDTGACFIPVIDDWGLTYDVNVDFAPADYSESAGLIGNGSTKRLRTGIPMSQFDSSKACIGAYIISDNGTSNSIIGAVDGNNYILLSEAINGTMSFYNRTTASATTSPMDTGFWVGANITSSTCSLYVNGGVVKTGAGLTLFLAEAVNQINIFARGTGATTASFYSNATLGGYIIAEGLTTADQVILNTAMEKFQDALGRGVQ